jgi:hypothetical protein
VCTGLYYHLEKDITLHKGGKFYILHMGTVSKGLKKSGNNTRTTLNRFPTKKLPY